MVQCPPLTARRAVKIVVFNVFWAKIPLKKRVFYLGAPPFPTSPASRWGGGGDFFSRDPFSLLFIFFLWQLYNLKINWLEAITVVVIECTALTSEPALSHPFDVFNGKNFNFKKHLEHKGFFWFSPKTLWFFSIFSSKNGINQRVSIIEHKYAKNFFYYYLKSGAKIPKNW